MEYSIESRPLSEAELDNVTGGVGLKTEEVRRIELARMLSEIYKSNNPPELGPRYLLDR